MRTKANIYSVYRTTLKSIDESGKERKVPALVAIIEHLNGATERVVIPKSEDPVFFEMLAKYGFAVGHSVYWTNKEERYRKLYMISEELGNSLPYKFTAYRHALSHSQITNTKTQRSLLRTFGTTNINLSRARDRRVAVELQKDLSLIVGRVLLKELLLRAGKSKERIGNAVLLRQ